MRITCIRHGEMAGDPFCTPSFPVSGCLSATGIAQAERTAYELAPEPFEVAFCSPYGRAMQTAQIVLAGRDIKPRVLDCLREWEPDRTLDDLPDTTYERIAAQVGDRYAEETWKTELGEGCFDMYARIIPPFLDALASMGIRHRMGGFVRDQPGDPRTIAVIAHGGSLNVLVSFLLGMPPFPVGRIAFDLAGYVTLDCARQRGILYPRVVARAPRTGLPSGTR